jgi:peptidoglycan/xylan/chitin deacetylase (PgdA/CDA1 family)
MRGHSLILAYHNVVPDELTGYGDRPLHIPFTGFARQLDLLQRHCRVAPLGEVLAGAASGDRPVVAITFDDAYLGAVELALPELGRRGLAGTVFVAPGLLGRPSLWWDDLADGPHGLAAAARQRALDADEGRDDRIRQAHPGSARRRPLPGFYGIAAEAQVFALAGHGHVTLGAHTWSHPNLTRIDQAAVMDELTRPLEWLHTAPGPTLAVLAYPYGLTSPPVEAAVARAGYTAALLVEGGWYKASEGPWRIPRYNVPAGLSDDGFMLRLSGVLGLSSISQLGRPF